MSTPVDTLVIGAGQAGLALSHYLTRAGHEHVLLDRGRIGQRWHDRWDSLTLLSPNWMNRLPGSGEHEDPHGFLDRAGFVSYLDEYARSFAAPVVEGVSVLRVVPAGEGFRVETTAGSWPARQVVVATGDADVPRLPSLAAPAGVHSLHASEYRRPGQLPGGAVLVVGAGASGQQLALELRRAGREVVLAAGRHSRAPRRYRGRDVFDWLQLLGDFDRTVDDVPDLAAARRVPLFPVSGANGGEELGLDLLHAHGVVVAGRLTHVDERQARFADDLAENMAKADERLRILLQRVDAHPLARGTHARALRDVVLPPGPRAVDVSRLGAIVWATGYGRAYPWLQVPGALDARGQLPQRRGVTRVPGLFVLGLAFQYRRSSHVIGGVGRDAETLARILDARAAGWRRRPARLAAARAARGRLRGGRRLAGRGAEAAAA
jgi:putative flavoprotein involved in K+ transport